MTESTLTPPLNLCLALFLSRLLFAPWTVRVAEQFGHLLTLRCLHPSSEGEAAQVAELARLEGMKDKKMKAEQKSFLFARLHILKTLTSPKEEL